MITQLSLFNNPANRSLPLPLVVAQKWGFSLQCHELGDEHWYAVQDWISGLIQEKVSPELMREIRNNLHASQLHVTKMPYRTSNGATHQRDFATAKTLYDVAQYLRLTKDRTALAAIRSYLSESGVFADEVRRNPELAEQQVAQLRRDKMARLGKGEEWLAERIEGMVARDAIEEAISLYISNPQRWHYGKITNEEYVQMFGRDAKTLRQQNGGVSPRDAMTQQGLALLRTAEYTISALLKERQRVSFDEAIAIVKHVIDLIRPTAEGLGNLLGVDLATGRKLIRG